MYEKRIRPLCTIIIIRITTYKLYSSPSVIAILQKGKKNVPKQWKDGHPKGISWNGFFKENNCMVRVRYV